MCEDHHVLPRNSVTKMQLRLLPPLPRLDTPRPRAHVFHALPPPTQALFWPAGFWCKTLPYNVIARSSPMAENGNTATPATDAATKAAEAGAKLGQHATQAASTIAAAGQDNARRAAETVAGFGRAAAETNKALFADVTRMFSDMRFPSMLPDAGVLMAAHRRNMDVLSQANRLALEGAQAVARRHMEIMQQTMTELTEHVRELASSDTPQHKAARQAELVKQSYERAVANIRELSDLIQRSNGEAVTLLNDRFREAMDEIKALLEKSGETTKA